MSRPPSRRRTTSDFAWDGFFNRVNGELVATWGNLVNRMLSFACKRFDGKVPAYDTLTDADKAMIARSEEGFEEIGSLLEQVRLRDALAACMTLAREANGYLDRRASRGRPSRKTRPTRRVRSTRSCV